ncbi:MAG: SpoVR family protein [Proteobacteria bacterium]|nr:SpoVR family protein [Pseudomonadota bacterium]
MNKAKKQLQQGPAWTFADLQEYYKVIEEVAVEEFNLDFYPNQLEIVTSEQMIDANASTGLPVTYNHWRYGKYYSYQSNSYKKGKSGLAYEMVINCLRKDTLVYTEEGIKEICELSINDKIWNGTSFSKVVAKKEQKSKLLKILLNNNTEIFATKNHIFPIIDSTGPTEKKLEDLKVGNTLILNSKGFENISRSEDRLNLVPDYFNKKYLIRDSRGKLIESEVEKATFLRQDPKLDQGDKWLFDNFNFVKIVSIVDSDEDDVVDISVEGENRYFIANGILTHNSNPCISYLMENNNLVTQALVIAHAAMGHNAFFKGNFLFKEWTHADAIVDYCLFARDFIADCEKKYGYSEVEKILDAAHSLEHHGVDKYKRPPQLSIKKEKELQQKRIEEDQKFSYEFWNTLPSNDKIDINYEEKVKFPKEPQENLLYFIEKHSPILKPWQREIIRIVRKLAQYFYPQGQCLVGSTYISTKKGLQKIEELIQNSGYFEKEEDVLSIDNKFEETSHFYKKKTKKTIKIKTRMGKEIEGTPEHPIQIINKDLKFEMKKLEDISKEDRIVIKVGYDNVFSNTPFQIKFNYPVKNTSVTCNICNKQYKSLSTHIPLHNISVEEYKLKYSNEIATDSVIYNRSKNFNIPIEMNQDLARLFGYYISEGHWEDDGFHISNSDQDVLEDIISIYNNLDIVFRKNIRTDGAETISVSNRKFFDFLEYCGLDKSKSYFKQIPTSILQSNKSVVCSFLSTLFEGDGMNTSIGVISYSSRSEELVKQIHLLLLHLGIHSKIRQYEHKTEVPHKTNYVLTVSKYHYDKFMNIIGFITDRKNADNRISKDLYVLGFSGIPYIKEIIHNLRSDSKNKIPVTRRSEFGWEDVDNQIELFENIKSLDLRLYYRLKEVINKENYYDEIVDISICEEEKYVYDFTIPSNHLFISDGFVSHNTRVSNEGFATFIHYEIIYKMFNLGYLTDGFMQNFLELHTNVVWQPDKSYLNPYYLGFNIYQDIKRICLNPTEEDKEWFPHLIGKDWKKEIIFAMQNFKDESFIMQYLSPTVIRKMRLFNVLDDSQLSDYHITYISNEDGYKGIRRILSQEYNRAYQIPDVQVTKANINGDRKLTLTYYPVNNIPLDNDDLEAVEEHLDFLWGFDTKIIEARK